MAIFFPISDGLRSLSNYGHFSRFHRLKVSQERENLHKTVVLTLFHGNSNSNCSQKDSTGWTWLIRASYVTGSHPFRVMLLSPDSIGWNFRKSEKTFQKPLFLHFFTEIPLQTAAVAVYRYRYRCRFVFPHQILPRLHISLLFWHRLALLKKVLHQINRPAGWWNCLYATCTRQVCWKLLRHLRIFWSLDEIRSIPTATEILMAKWNVTNKMNRWTFLVIIIFKILCQSKLVVEFIKIVSIFIFETRPVRLKWLKRVKTTWTIGYTVSMHQGITICSPVSSKNW